MIVTDASFWVSALRYHDIHRPATLAWLNEYLASGREISAPTLLIAEVSGAIACRTGQSRLGRAVIERLDGYKFLRLFPVNHNLALTAAELAADCRLRGADAVYAALAYTFDVPLISWDQEQIAHVQKVIQAGIPGTHFGSNGHSDSGSTPAE